MAEPERSEETAAEDVACSVEPGDKPTLLLHIGPGKTGSSAIQAWLASIADELIPYGILYPPPIKEIAAFSGNGQDLAALLHLPHSAPGADVPQKLEDTFNHYAALAAERNCHTVLLSSEFLPEAPRENLELLRKCVPTHFEPRVIGFVRDPYWWLWSAWGQSVKRGGLSEDFENYALRNISYYSETLCTFVSLFEGTKLLVYRYKTLIEDFANAVGIPKELFGTAQEARVNRSLDKEELEVLLAVNRVFQDAALSTHISDKMISDRPHSKPYKYFSPAVAAAIREANDPILASVKHLIVSSKLPVIDEWHGTSEISEEVPSNSPRIDAGLFHMVLSAIAAWQEESSSFPRLRRLANEPAREAAFKEVLPEGFNSIEYLLINPDVLAAGADPVAHYLSYGRAEGRQVRRPNGPEESISRSATEE
ncbi:MAG: hypothetical protein WAW54_10140 [Parvibaculum sedimenti]|uniref:hypothetical protein n=1 Tax=Parvibaculum sedimenti TaxID=2608632 RepID=UPI003BB5F909